MEMEDSLEGVLLLNVVIRKGVAILTLNHLIEDIVSGRANDFMMTDKCDGSPSSVTTIPPPNTYHER